MVVFPTDRMKGKAKKVRMGVSFDPDLEDALGRHAEALKDLGVTRSEVVNAVLSEFFEDNDTSEAVWDVVSKRRVKRRG